MIICLLLNSKLFLTLYFLSVKIHLRMVGFGCYLSYLFFIYCFCHKSGRLIFRLNWFIFFIQGLLQLIMRYGFYLLSQAVRYTQFLYTYTSFQLQWIVVSSAIISHLLIFFIYKHKMQDCFFKLCQILPFLRLLYVQDYAQVLKYMHILNTLSVAFLGFGKIKLYLSILCFIVVLECFHI